MSHAPNQAEGSEYARDFVDAFRQLEISLNDGGMSWSGNERNCFFLNTGPSSEAGQTSRFADVSAVSGFDFIDDGRSAAAVDWDQDGDLDLWLGNRSGPQLRFLRNDAGTSNHYLSVRLVGDGTTTNRDAIGSRITVIAEGQSELPLIQTLRAGEGYISQSSKWLLFGLGESDKVERLTVLWPNGQEETFEGLMADSRYEIVQGADEVRLTPPPNRTVRLTPSVIGPYVPSGISRTLLYARVQAPRLEYENFEGQAVNSDALSGGPLLVNLWSTTCQSCLLELKEFSDHRDEFQQAGLRVLALSTDALGGYLDDTTSTSRQLLERLNYAYDAGMATPQAVSMLEGMYMSVVRYHPRLPVPTSFLFDAQGRLAVIYKGPVSVDTLLEDVRMLDETAKSRLLAALPFNDGRMFKGVNASPGMGYTTDALQQHIGLEAALSFLEVRQQELKIDEVFYDDADTFVMPYYNIASNLAREGQQERAIDIFANALDLAPNSHRVHFNMGVALAELQRDEEAIDHFQAALFAEPSYFRARKALATVLHDNGNLEEAVEHYRIVANSPSVDPLLVDRLARALVSLGRSGEALPYLRVLAETDANSCDLQNRLGAALQAAGNNEEAADAYRSAVEMEPNNSVAHAGLGAALAALEQRDEAIRQLQFALDLDPGLEPARTLLAELLTEAEAP